MNQDGQTVSLADYADQWVVLCFYPRDDTPGCTKEAFEFTKEISAFRKLGPLVLGCSSGSPDLHRVFIRQHKPKGHAVVRPDTQDHGAVRSLGREQSLCRATVGVRRSTVLIDPAGKVAHH
jgi:peroxiredoxin Q/BCP